MIVPPNLPRLAAVVALLGTAPAAAEAPLADALAILRAHRTIDLTRAFDGHAPAGPLFGPPRLTPAVDPRTLEALTIARHGLRATYYAFAGPTGTHVEAPAAVAADGRTLDEVAPDEMILPLVVIDAPPPAGPAHPFSPDDLAGWEREHGPVPRGCFVALRTGGAPAMPTPAAWSIDALRVVLEERGAAAVGFEDAAGAGGSEGAAYVLRSGRWLIAGLDALDRVPATGALLVASWPKPAGGLAFPARAVAVLP